MQAVGKLQLVALVEDQGRLLAFVAQGDETQKAAAGDVLHGRFLVKEVADGHVVLASPEEGKEAKLWLAPGGPSAKGPAQ